MSTLKKWMRAAVAVLVCACGGGGARTASTPPNVPAHVMPDGGAPGPGGADGGTSAGPEELASYVKRLINDHTNDTEPPDDVASRTFMDSEDPSAFDNYFH